MTYIASGYFANRIAGLLLTLLFLTFSWIQIFLLHQHSKKLTEAKYFIHYSVNLCVLTIFFNFIDPYGVFGLLTYFFGILVLDAIGTKFLLSSAIFIIYGHFKAHYRILKQDTPKFFLQYLFGIFIITFIGNLIWTIVLEFTQQRIYSQLINITTVFCLIGIWIIDLYGYWLVRKLMIELHHAAAGPTDAATDVPTSSAFQRNLFDYEEFLSRMKRFHFLLSIFFLIFVSLTLYGLAGSGNIRKGLDPNKFNFWDGLIFYPYLYLLICCLLTWWVWIPIKIKDCTLHLDSNHGESQKTTKAPSTHTDLSKQHQQVQEEELVHLNSNDQPSPVLISDDQPSPVLIGDNDASTRPVRDVARSLSQDENSLIGVSGGGNGNRENSVSVSEIESPKKDNPAHVTMAGITEEGGIVVV